MTNGPLREGMAASCVPVTKSGGRKRPGATCGGPL